MRRVAIVLLSACLATACLSPAASAAAKLGKAIYLRAPADRPGDPPDVYEADLDTGTARIVVPHTALPKGFQTRISSASPDSVGIRPLWAKRKALFTWPWVQMIAQSSRGVFAILGAGAFSLVSAKGKCIRRFGIPVDDSLSAELSFSPEGSWLVIGTTHAYGEPRFDSESYTFLVNTRTTEPQVIAWFSNGRGYVFRFSAEDEVRGQGIAGWLPGDRFVILFEDPYPDDSCPLRLGDVMGKVKSRRIFDAGANCRALELWSGK